MAYVDDLWDAIKGDLFPRILAHPFLAGLTDGTLPREAFRHYVLQDALYLRDFGRGLAHLAARGHDDEHLLMFCRHAEGTVLVERALHAGFLDAWGLDRASVDQLERSPTCDGYTGYILRAAYTFPYGEALAAFLPCYWIYAEVGKALTAQGSPEPLYQRWIDTYAGEEFQTVVNEMKHTVNAVTGRLDAVGQARAMRAFLHSSRYEWRFWDSAFRREGW